MCLAVLYNYRASVEKTVPTRMLIIWCKHINMGIGGTRARSKTQMQTRALIHVLHQAYLNSCSFPRIGFGSFGHSSIYELGIIPNDETTSTTWSNTKNQKQNLSIIQATTCHSPRMASSAARVAVSSVILQTSPKTRLSSSERGLPLDARLIRFTSWRLTSLVFLTLLTEVLPTWEPKWWQPRQRVKCLSQSGTGTSGALW